MLTGSNLSLKHVLLKKYIYTRATVAGQVVRGSLAAMVTSTLCSFAGAAFPFFHFSICDPKAQGMCQEGPAGAN